MLCSRRWSVLILLLTGPLHAQDKWADDRALTLSPQPAPVPALKYRLFPLSIDRKPGNAAPIYLRFAHERTDQTKKDIWEKTDLWNPMPIDKLPVKEAREFLKSHAYNLKQLELGARRTGCSWEYTFDAGDPIEMRLPDAQEMRMHAKLLVLKARVEIAEGNYEEAARTLETGFAFAQHLAEAPLLINGLVGLACATMCTDATIDLVSRPDAPNLYWSLTALPRPLIDMRKGFDLEQRVFEMEFPELAALDRQRTPEQWDALLLRARQGTHRLLKLYSEAKDKPLPEPDATVTDKDLAAATKWLKEKGGLAEKAVAALPKSRAALLAFVGEFREVRDDWFKVTYLPYLEARPVVAEMEKRAMPDTEAGRIAKLLLPSIFRVQFAATRFERKIAAVRVIEAIRLHAVASEGQLPEKLGEVKVVPVPNDPVTGKPFEYKPDGQTATITSVGPDGKPEMSGLRYAITLRK